MSTYVERDQESNLAMSDTRLAQLYQRTPGAVAFVDESYSTTPRPGQPAFYSMSAVTFTKDQLDGVRQALTQIVGGRFWHTTEAFRDGHTRPIARMAAFLARETQWNIVTVDLPMPEMGAALERARATCLAAIAREVTRGTGPDAVRLIVADRNKDQRLNHGDQAVLNQLRALGDVDPNVALYHGRMGDEPVLWAADLVSWSAYRNLSVDDGRWIAPLRDVLTVLDARTGLPVEMKQPQAAVAPGAVAPTPGAPQPTAAQRGQVTVASEASLPGGEVSQRGFTFGGAVLGELAARVAVLRRDAGARGVVQGNTPQAIAARVAKLRRDAERAVADDDPGPVEPVRGPQL